ncbi:hypothetical protein [Streptomyces fumanus]|nr:hypothetical protein [Streptomyces fumanus]
MADRAVLMAGPLLNRPPADRQRTGAPLVRLRRGPPAHSPRPATA